MQVITLSPADLAEIRTALRVALMNQTRVRVAIEDGFKLDTGDGTGWSLPYGTDTTGRS